MSGSDSRRAALEAAFDAADNEELDVEETTEVPDDNDEPDAGDDDTSSEKVGEESTEEEVDGEPAKPAKSGKKPTKDSQQVEQEAAARKTPAKPGVKPAAGQATQPAPGQIGAPSADNKPPVSWTPAEREHWGKIPPEAQAAIRRRDLETSRALNESAQSRKFQTEFVDVVKPFAHLIRARNSTPLQAVKNLMETAAGLTTGNQQQKAIIVAEILDNYGVDIKTLDEVLSKRPANPNAGAGALPPQLESVLRPIHDFMGRMEQGRAQHIRQIQESAAKTVEEAESNLPFFEDLREDIADFMEVAASRGQELTIQQAHTMAVNFRPDIKKIIDQRARAERVNKDPSKVAKSKRAASSINGVPRGGTGGDGKVKTRRQALSEAWDDNA